MLDGYSMYNLDLVLYSLLSDILLYIYGNLKDGNLSMLFAQLYCIKLAVQTALAVLFHRKIRQYI